MNYSKNSEYKIKCPDCGGTEFYYKEIRTINVQIEELHTYSYMAKHGVEAKCLQCTLGADYPDQGGGEVPDEWYSYGKVCCSACHRELGWRQDGPNVELYDIEIDEDDN